MVRLHYITLTNGNRCRQVVHVDSELASSEVLAGVGIISSLVWGHLKSLQEAASKLELAYSLVTGIPRELLRSIQLPAASAGLSHPAVHLTATAKVMSPSLSFQVETTVSSV
ncbi:hypothetical protein DPX16_18708 [Anabarilius grahami]|uniref:Uncharacterized protein n=1 Tax=Anabarilius grahami TaxID=495550 RepID=A0A3N0Z1M2_ANAGA|nr:hypothetical protein DPX16_18708 [Anabarilius grahami]